MFRILKKFGLLKSYNVLKCVNVCFKMFGNPSCCFLNGRTQSEISTETSIPYTAIREDFSEARALRRLKNLNPAVGHNSGFRVFLYMFPLMRR